MGLITGTVGRKNATSTALETNRVVKATPGTAYFVTVASTLGSAQFIQFHDATALPADTAVPVWVANIPANGNLNIPLSIYGRVFANGIVVCNSTTAATKTIGAANCFFDIQYQ